MASAHSASSKKPFIPGDELFFVIAAVAIIVFFLYKV